MKYQDFSSITVSNKILYALYSLVAIKFRIKINATLIFSISHLFQYFLTKMRRCNYIQDSANKGLV